MVQSAVDSMTARAELCLQRNGDHVEAPVSRILNHL